MTSVMDERQAAAAAGLLKFASSVPCRKAGHVGMRYASTGACLSCIEATRLEHPKPLGAKAPKRHMPQRLELNLYLPTTAWREIWTQEHTNLATVLCQEALNKLLKSWIDAMPAQEGENPNK